MTTAAAIDLSQLSPLERTKLGARLYREQLAHTDHVFAYAIQAGENGPVKIGLAKNPRERLATLQTGNHEELRGLAAWRVLPIEEKLLHDEFRHAHIRGEWFRPVPELTEHVLFCGGDFIDWTKA